MSAPKTEATASKNEVQLIGRLSQAPEERVLPSGDSVWTFRVVVPRRRSTGKSSAGKSGAGKSRQTVDAIECAAWSSRARRSVSGWAADDVVEVTGELHRRFFRSGGAVASRVEVEMSSGKVIRRAASG